MGAKQSKRSVDISGKEAEGGEVAVAGAGGEGRVEALADVDALKPQANGDAHIHVTDKEKQLDVGTPENEKDATTEKEGKEEEVKDDKEKKEVAPVTNGDSEPKENGETAAEPAPEPTPEEGKKPKKEKVKKKWSLRSISFSRKDKPKQEKKQKDEEPKINGEPEKVPEEAAEATPENAASEAAEEAKPEEVKDEKTPDTPVTEPLTNGSSTPDSPEAEEAAPVNIPAADTASVAAVEIEKHEPKAETQPEQLPVNGLSLEEPNLEVPAVLQSEESKPKETVVETAETVPAPEIPVKKEVCVEQMPLESPPPLPANPPPSSVVSFAATTMAPELTEASLANTADLNISTLPLIPNTDVNTHYANAPLIDIHIEVIACTDEINLTHLPSLKDEKETKKADEISTENTQEFVENVDELQQPQIDLAENIVKKNNILKNVPDKTQEKNDNHIENFTELKESVIEKDGDSTEVLQKKAEELKEKEETLTQTQIETLLDPTHDEVKDILGNENDIDAVDDLPPPPSPLIDDMSFESDIIDKSAKIETANKTMITLNHCKLESNGIIHNETEDTAQENLKNKTKDLLDNITHELNGNMDATTEEHKTIESMAVIDLVKECVNSVATTEESTPPSLSEASESLPLAAGATEMSDALPPPPQLADLALSAPLVPPQEPLPLPVSDKLADLIPEVPVVPDLQTETLQETSEVALAN